MNIVHQPSLHRFILENFPSCYIEYTLDGRIFTVEHTVVEESMHGQGIAGKLAAAACSWAKSHQYTVASHCSYMDVWLKRHPQI